MNEAWSAAVEVSGIPRRKIKEVDASRLLLNRIKKALKLCCSLFAVGLSYVIVYSVINVCIALHYATANSPLNSRVRIFFLGWSINHVCSLLLPILATTWIDKEVSLQKESSCMQLLLVVAIE